MYDEVNVIDDAIRVYEEYVVLYPRPLDLMMETRTRLAEIYKSQSDYSRYYDALQLIVREDDASGTERTDRSRYLASQAALVIAEQSYNRFAELELTLPFEDSLAEKQRRMDDAMAVFEKLVDYQVADVPFEERAIEVHQENFELLRAGVFNPWVEDSLGKLTELMPGRYARNEISGGFLATLDIYAYRMPNAPPVGVEGPLDAAVQEENPAAEPSRMPSAMATEPN